MKYKRPVSNVEEFSSYQWSQRTSYSFLAKRRYPAELNDVTLAKHGRLERELQLTKKTIDSIRSKAIQDIETQRKALRQAIHGSSEDVNAKRTKNMTQRNTNSVFRNIQDEKTKLFGNRSKLYKGDRSIYLSKERFEQVRDDINERLADSTETSLRTEKFKILLKRPSSADLLRKVRRMGPLGGVRDVTSPQSDSCVIVTSKRS